MQLWSIWRDSNHSNANSNYSKGILTIQTRFETFKCKFQAFQMDSNANLRHSIEILPFESKFEAFKRDSNHSIAILNHLKGILTIRNRIWTIQMRFKAFECKFQLSERDSNANLKHSNEIQSIQIQIWPFQRVSNHSKPNLKHSNALPTIRKGF